MADAVLALLGHGAHFDIFSACGMNDLERVLELAREDSSVVMQRGEMGMTPLHWASRSGSIPCLKWLLRHGRRGRCQDHYRPNPAAPGGREGESRGGLASGRGTAPISMRRDRKGRTPLHRAAYEGRLEVAEVLIVLGADRRPRTRSGKRPLQVARLDCRHLKEE